MSLPPESCSYVLADGARCRNRVGLRSGVDGRPLCSWHDPGRRARMAEARAANASAPPPVRAVALADLPVQEIETPDDALRLARWVPIAIATGVLGGREAQAMVASLREWRMANADAGLLARLEALEERIRAARARGLDV